MEDRFRVSLPRTVVMTAFMGPEVAPLFAQETFDIPDDAPVINLLGTETEREMNAMMGGIDELPYLSFISHQLHP